MEKTTSGEAASSRPDDLEKQKGESSSDTHANSSKSLDSSSAEQWLWVDPLAHDDRNNSGAVLLDDVILDYVFKYNLLFEKTEFAVGKLKGGSYTMTPASKGGWIFMPNPKPNKPDIKTPLEIGEDEAGLHYIVPKNSLVYIRLGQALRMPFYIIGRHNLKIRYVYKGLLLGTGPQVDPGFRGYLFIPLHNFTTSDVKVYIKESFVSIDFVRTTRFIDEKVLQAGTESELRSKLKGVRNLIDEVKVSERTDLEKYLGGSTPRSQMAQFQFDFERLAIRVDDEMKGVRDWMRTEKEKVDKELDRVKNFAMFERVLIVITVAGLMYAALTYFRGFVADLKAETREVRALGSALTIREAEQLPAALSSASAANRRVSEVEARLERVEAQLQKLLTNVSVPNIVTEPKK